MADDADIPDSDWHLGTSLGYWESLKSALIPFRDIKEAGRGLQYDVLKAAFEPALWSAISSLISWIVIALSSTM